MDYQAYKSAIMSDPTADLKEKMRLSAGGKALTESPVKAYKDIGLVATQLDSMNNSIAEYRKDQFLSDAFNPITGLIANKNPWDTKAQEIKAKLQALVPKVARGIFGEVGVLTDQDIANYLQTLPNLKQTADTQDVVQYAILGTLKSALDNAVEVDSSTYDVSGLVGKYEKINKKLSELEKKII